MRRTVFKYFGPLFGVSIFIFALFVLHHEIRSFHYHQIIHEFAHIPTASIVLATLFAIVNYLVLGLYEIEGFKYIRKPLPWYKICFASFIAFVFSNNVGFYSISGGAVRYRLYSSWGLSTFDITKIISYCSILTFWLGLCTITGVVFVIEPLFIPSSLHIPHISIKFIGFLLLSLVGLFLLISIIRKKSIKILNWEFEMPPWWLSIALIGTACADWLLFGATLYVLLPANTSVSFALFMGYFLLAMLAGLISHVPGGLGVFETMFILLFHGQAPTTSMLGALLAFRIIYYLIPLVLSVLLLGSYEIYSRRQAFKGVARVVSKWGTTIIPIIFAVAVFASGVILLISGATPGEKIRMEWLTEVIPLPLLEVSHFLGSITGILLLVVSWGIYRRLDSSYYMSLYILAAGAIMSCLKGLDYEEAIVLSCTAIALFPCKRHFYRKSSLLHEKFTLGWILAVLAVFVSTIWLGFFAYRHVSYSSELWWQFSFFGNASRFLRASAGSAVAVMVIGLVRLFTPARPLHLMGSKVPIDKVNSVLQNSKDTYSQLALLGDKQFLFSTNEDAFIMYGVEGRSWIAMGDPVGTYNSIVPLIWDFREVCDRHNGRTIFYEVGKDNLFLYIDIGLTLVKIGESARVDIAKFNLDGGSKKTLRYTNRKLSQGGCSFEVVDKEQVSEIIPALKKISDEWMKEKNTREKKFSLGNFNEEYMKNFPFGIVKFQNEIVAFTNIWTTKCKEEISVDLMRYSSCAPNGVMDFLYLNLIEWGKKQGYHYFDLGMAPFSGMENHALAPLWSKLGAFLYGHGENYYNFQGLRNFKDKFEPIWEPKYIACPGGFSLPVIIKDIASLISGGVKGIFTK